MSAVAKLEPKAVTIRVVIEHNNVLVRRHCFTCGGLTEKDCAHPMIRIPEEDADLFMCDECFNAGADEIKARMQAQAARLNEQAQDLQELAQAEWELPPPAALDDERRKIEEDWTYIN